MPSTPACLRARRLLPPLACALTLVALAAAAPLAAAQCELARLTEPPGSANPFAFFGSSVDVDDGTIVAGNGAWFAAEDVPSWVFDPSPAGGWAPAVSLPATGKMTLYGSTVAVDGDVAVVGGQAFDDAETQGYVFERVGGTWGPTAQLVAPGSSWQFGDGLHVDVDGDTIVVASAFDAAVRVFERGDGSWPLVQELVAFGPQPVVWFALEVALQGDRMVVGGAQDDGLSPYPGLACVYDRQAGTWQPTAQLVPLGGQEADSVGNVLALDGDTIVLGAPHHDLGFQNFDFGAVFVFELAGGTWQQTATLQAPDKQTYDRFGSALALQDETLVVGTPYRKVAGQLQAGVAHVFRRDAGAWTPVAVLSADAPAEYARYGSALALQGDLLAVGAPYASYEDAVLVVRGVSGLPFWTAAWGAVGGADGTPCSAGLGAPAVGGPGGVVLTGAPAEVPGWLVLSLDRINAPFKGGVMVPAPDLLLPLLTDAVGAHEQPWAWPTGLPAGLELWMQHWLPDAGAPQGFAGSNGLGVTLP